MTITQLAALDAAERVRLHAAAVEAVRWQIARVAKRKGRTDFLTAHLAALESSPVAPTGSARDGVTNP